MLSCTATKHKEPASVWLIDDFFHFEIRVNTGNLITLFSMLHQLCRENQFACEPQESKFLIVKSAHVDVIQKVVDFLKSKDVEVIIPPIEMSA
jgi:hypothetical protein